MNEVIIEDYKIYKRSFFDSNKHPWNQVFPQTYFAYNQSTSLAIGVTSFKVVCSVATNPNSPLDLNGVGGDANENVKMLIKCMNK